MSKRRYPTIGSISSGTLRDEDLIPSFAWELEYLVKSVHVTREQLKRFNALIKECDEFDFDAEHDYDPSELTSELIDALNEIAPPYCYFGASDGDGACFGFWPIDDDDQLPRLVAGDPIPREHWGDDVYLVNDHGNVDCGHVDARGRFHAYWSCV